jgi:HAAS domain-containing protein
VNSTAQDEITAYVEGVRAALTGLPEATVLELLDDLPEHLAEVQAEGTGTLTERLGTPQRYAAELRATAGFVGGFPEPPTSAWESFADVRDKAVKLLHQADAKAGPVIGYPTASEFLVLLRPAWWVLRGYLAAMTLAYLLSDYSSGLLPTLGGSVIFGLVLLTACVVASISFGRRGSRLKPWPRFALYSATVFLVIFALTGVLNAGLSNGPTYSDAGNYDSNPYSNVQDVFVYDTQGHLVQGARLFDQEGSPIMLGNAYCTDPTTQETVHTRNMGYPYCPELAPFAAPSTAVPSTAVPSTAVPSVAASPSRTVPALPSSSASAPEPTPAVTAGK